MARAIPGYLTRAAAMLMALLLVCGAASAATVTPGGSDRDIDLRPGFLVLVEADSEGRFEQIFRNMTGATIDNLVFRFMSTLKSEVEGRSGGLFGQIGTSPDLGRVTFDLGGGSGIAAGQRFRIRMSGLDPHTQSAFGRTDPGPPIPPVTPSPGPDASPGVVPLPPAALLLAGGLGGLVLLRGRRRPAAD